MKPYKILLSLLLVMGFLTMTFLGCQKEAQTNPTAASNASTLTIAGALDRSSNLSKDHSDDSGGKNASCGKDDSHGKDGSDGKNASCGKGGSDERDGSCGKNAAAYDTLTLTCAGGTQSTLGVTVTAGASGASAGFSIQWLPKSLLDANNGVWPADTNAYCEASFSGVPSGGGTNVYNLPANGSVTVYIGDLLNAQLNQQLGLTTSCSGALTCGTQYVFRAFANASSNKKKSGFSYLNTSCATTASCPSGSK